jgi:UDP-glucose 4-epimerase
VFSQKKLLITGGTGTFGNAMVQSLLDSDISEIRIFSRDEKKQEDMRKSYSSTRLKFYIGDVRSKESLIDAMRDVDYVFHAAALKQVPSCEFFPLEAIRTNTLGADNVLSVAVASGVQRVICLSTDKAVYPINAMGMSKALMEKVVVAKARSAEDTVICCTRYGNVMASRGSVIPLFIDQVQRGMPITVTNPRMTRFMMTISEAVDLVLWAFRWGKPGDIFVQKAPAATILNIADAIIDLVSGSRDIKIIGTRHGEKLHETLLTAEEMSAALDMGDYYRIPPDERGLAYDLYFESGRREYATEGYTSENTKRLDLDETKYLIKGLGLI